MHEDDSTQPVGQPPTPEPEPATEPEAASTAAADAGKAPAPAPTAVGPVVAAPEDPTAAAAAATTATVGTTAAPARRPRKRLGLAGQVVGVVGIVVCLLLAVGVIIGRGWAIDQVEAVAASVDESLARGEPLIATVSGKVSDIDARLDNLREAAAAVASADSPAPALLTALSERISEVSSAYLEFRANYGEARERIVSVIERLQMLDRIVPGIEIPQGPIDAIATLDARLQELDANVMSVIGEGGVAASLQEAGERIATRLDQADALLAEANVLLAEADAKLAETRAKVADTADTLTTIISIGSLVLVILLLYIALLHWILFRSATGARRGDAAA